VDFFILNPAQNNKQIFIVKIFAKPSSKIPSKMEWDKNLNQYVVYVKSPASKGKANKEILKIARKYFLAEAITMINGFKSKIKQISVENPKKIPKTRII